MPAGGILYPHSPEFDRFLLAFVGEDRKGNAVTVLSALARLELEPWEEADPDLLDADCTHGRSDACADLLSGSSGLTCVSTKAL